MGRTFGTEIELAFLSRDSDTRFGHLVVVDCVIALLANGCRSMRASVEMA